MNEPSFDDTTKESNPADLTARHYEFNCSELSGHERDDVEICRAAIDTVVLNAQNAPHSHGSVCQQNGIPRFERIRFLGAGGFGIVFAAFDRSLEIDVAIKFLRPSRVSSIARQRFLEEAKITVGLTHPNIVRMYDSGVICDVPFITTSYVDGGSLADLIISSSDGLPSRNVAEIGCQVADAVAFAHSKATFHRDLKPSNILIQREPTNHPNYRATLTDFGLAKRWDREIDHGFTQEGEVPGTVRYMSPEQAKGDIDNFSVQSEVFSLGIILYQMATGVVPFEGTKNSEIRNQIVNQRPKKPSAIIKSFPRELEAIILKCLEKESYRRYDTVAELSKDLRRFLSGEPVLASRPSQWRLAVWYAKTHPLTTTLVTSTFLTLLISASLISYAFWNQRIATKKEFKTKVDYIVLFGSLIDDVVAGKKEQSAALLEALSAFRCNLEEDLESNPGNPELQHLLSLIHHYESIVHQRTHNALQSIESRIDSVAILKQLRFRFPKNKKYRFQYIYGIVTLAISMQTTEVKFPKESTQIKQEHGLFSSRELVDIIWPEIIAFTSEFPTDKAQLSACNQFKSDLAERFLDRQTAEFHRIKDEVISDSVKLAEQYPHEIEFIKPAIATLQHRVSHCIAERRDDEALIHINQANELFDKYLRPHLETLWVKTYYVEMKSYHATALFLGGHWELVEKICIECTAMCRDLNLVSEHKSVISATTLKFQTLLWICENQSTTSGRAMETMSQILFVLESPETPSSALQFYADWLAEFHVPAEVSETLTKQLALRGISN